MSVVDRCPTGSPEKQETTNFCLDDIRNVAIDLAIAKSLGQPPSPILHAMQFFSCDLCWINRYKYDLKWMTSDKCV